jgi:excisionase family DNA binding protein
MSRLGDEYLTTKELAELLHLKERKVYDLAASGQVPCSRATGKLLFPRQAVEAWIASKSSGPAKKALAERPAVFLGSHDPLLEWSLRESRCGLATFFDGSLDGLERFAAGEGAASALHLYSAEDDDWNTPAVRSRFGNEPVALIEFAWRERGLIVGGNGDSRPKGLADLRGQRVVPRQSGAGSQALLEHLLGAAGIAITELNLMPAARSERDAAVAVLEGDADIAFGLRGLADQYRLEFVPVCRERFDLLVDRRAWFEEPLQTLNRFFKSPEFAERAAGLRGYDIDGLGTVHFNGG